MIRDALRDLVALPNLLGEGPTLRVLSLRQPFASLVACGRKRIETRPKGSRQILRALEFGLFAVHASAGEPLPCEPKYLQALDRESAPRGVIVAVVLAGASSTYTAEHADAACFLDPHHGLSRGSLDLLHVVKLARPIPFKGALGIGARVSAAALLEAIDEEGSPGPVLPATQAAITKAVDDADAGRAEAIARSRLS